MISFLRKYVHKFQYAFAGFFHGASQDASIRLQCLIACAVIVLCLFCPLTRLEWCIILLLIGSIIALEFVNSAIETIVDMISPQYSLEAKKIKDYAAAAVLTMSLVAAVVGLIIIGGSLL